MSRNVSLRLFSSVSPQRTPHISRMIRIDVPDFVSYRAGSTVSGTVSVDPAVTAHTHSISVNLRGHSKTQIDETASITPWGARVTKEFRGSLPLFCQNLSLYNGPITSPALSTWPFSFTFPSNCDPPPADVSLFGRFLFNSDIHHLLPPSCSDVQTRSGGGLQYSVFYEVEACIQTRDSSQRMITSKSATKRLTYLSSACLDHPILRPILKSCRIDCQSVLLPAKYKRQSDARPRTLGERMGLKSIIPDAGGTAIFWLRVKVPTVAVVNQTLPLVLSIDHDVELSTTPHPPTVLLKRVKAVLEATPEIRCDRGHQSAHWTREYTIIDHTFSKPTPVTEDIELTNFKLRKGLIPSFSSFVVQLKHALVIELTVECAQKTFVNTFRTVDEFMLMAESQPSGAQQNGALAPISPSIEVPNTRPPPLFDMDPPPPYEP